MRRRNFLVSSAASLLGTMVKVGRGSVWAAKAPKVLPLADEAKVPATELEGGPIFTDAVKIPGSWQPLVPGPRADFGFDPLHYETTFQELRPGRLAPINTKTAVGVPGWPVMGFGHLMRARYSEFQMRFSVESGGRERMPHTLANFRQTSPGDWLPGAVSEWDEGGVHYRVSYIVVPNEPQPVDLYEISLKNTSQGEAQGHLLVTLDGAETLKAEGELIGDRGKPLVMMDPVVPMERIARDAGCVDPRATPAGPWGFGTMQMNEWRSHRDGWYGMPVEYLMRVKPGERLQVFLGFGGTPQPYTANWEIPLNKEDPAIAELYDVRAREVVAIVEGEAEPQKILLEINKKAVLGFVGEDTNGDGYIKVSVRATPESRQPATLSQVWGFEMGSPVTAQQLVQNDGGKIKARYRINVGEDLPRSIDDEAAHFGTDLTVFVLRLRYEPKLGPGEEKRYLLRLPAIDKPEMAPYGNSWRPYDTGESWKPYMDPRHPENKVPYGEDVPVGMDPSEYAVNGPKPREVWKKQLAAARAMNWQAGIEKLTDYWNQFVSKAARFLTPEPYLDHLYKHQLAVLKMHIVGFVGQALQLTGPDWYWDIAVSRDVPYMYQVWDLSGYPDVADFLWKTLLTPRKEIPRNRWTLGQWDGDTEHEGLWMARTGQWDGQGQILWSLTQHYLLTGNQRWLVQNYPKISCGADWIVRAIQREKDRLGNPNAVGYGMLPPGTGEAGGVGHNFYLNSFALLGLRSAARVAEVMGRDAKARQFSEQARDLSEVFHTTLRTGFFRLNDFAGSISLGPEWSPERNSFVEQNGRRISTDLPVSQMGGALVWPTEAMAPLDPLMNGWCRYREHEAELRGGVFDYYAVDWGLGYIPRGEPDRAADWFYAYVDNAATTLDWGEGMVLDSVFPEFTPACKGVRTEGQMPHAFASALYIWYLRHLFLWEEGRSLHLAPATPRKWLAQPQPIGVEGAPSEFGNVTYHLTADPDRTTVRGEIQLDESRKPQRLLVHVRAPGGRGLKAVKINGQNWEAFDRETVVISKPASKLDIEAELIA